MTTNPSVSTRTSATTRTREMDNKDLVHNALTEIFIKKNYDAADTYYAENYVPHTAVVFIGNGRAGFKKWVKGYGPTIQHYEIGFMMAEGNIVFAHTLTVNDASPVPFIGMEVWRIENGQIAEFWSEFTPETIPTETDNGNALFPIRDKVDSPSRSVGK